MENNILNIEISKPIAGWSSLIIEDNEKQFCGSLSYIDYVPEMFLEAIINKLKTHKDQVIRFDEEGSEFLIIITDIGIYTIADRKKLETNYFFISDYVFAEKICSEILENIDDWAEFNLDSTDERNVEKEKKNNKENLIKLIEEIKKLINKKHS